MVVVFVYERFCTMNLLPYKEFLMRSISGAVLLGCMAGSYFHSIAMFSFLLIAVLLVILFFEWPALMPTSPIRYFFVSIIYPFFPFACLIYLNYRYHYDSMWLPLYPFLIAWAADTFGYIVGKAIGRNKMCPNISPGKSWEGFIGSMIGIMLINLLILPKITAAPFSYYADFWYILGPTMGWIFFTLFCLCQTTIAFLGGMFISKLKRSSGVKDAGTILPGHGGFLDRFDSVLTTVLFVWIIIWTKKLLR